MVDDGSTDGTADVVGALRRSTHTRWSGRRTPACRRRGIAGWRSLWRSLPATPSRKWRGSSSAAGAGGAALLFLDADDWLAPDALSRLAAALEASPDAVAASGACAFVGSTGVVRRPPSGDILERLLVRNLFANGGHLLLRSAAVQAAGGFLPGIAYGEDWEFWIRIALLGPVVVTPGRSAGAVRAAACRRRLSTPRLRPGRIRTLHGRDLRQPGPDRALRAASAWPPSAGAPRPRTTGSSAAN